MKNLLFKEFRLSIHPLIYIFVFAFPMMYFIPNYPSFIPLIYVVSSYSILFLGANKGQTTNDLLYTCLLPLRKKDVVTARVLTISVIQIVSLLLMLIFLPIGNFLNNMALEEATEFVGLSSESMIMLLSLLLIGFSINDFVFVPWFYKTGRKLIWPQLVAIFVFCFFSIITIIALPGKCEGLREFCRMDSGNLLIQLIILLGSILIYVFSKIIIRNIAAKKLEKIDL